MSFCVWLSSLATVASRATPAVPPDFEARTPTAVTQAQPPAHHPERAARASRAARAAVIGLRGRPGSRGPGGGRDLPRIESSLRGRAALQTQVHPVKRQCHRATPARRRRGHSPPAPRPLASPQFLTTRDTWARRGCRSAGLAVWLLHQRTKRAIVGPFWTERKVPENWRHARGRSPPRTPVPGATK